MHRLALVLVAVVTALGCGGGSAAVEPSSPTGPAEAIAEVPPPDGTLAVPVPEAEWTPVSIGQGPGADLVRALADRKSVAIILGRGMDDAVTEERVFEMVKAAAPATRVLARARGTLDRLLEERGEIPYRVTRDVGGVDILGRPYFVPKEHPLNTEWLARKQALKGAEAMLTVREIRVDDRRLREMREKRRGDCSAMTGPLSEAVSRARAFFAPLVERADGLLDDAFARRLRDALPAWREETDRQARDAEPGSGPARCAEAYRKALDRAASCEKGSCEARPRLFAAAGGIVGMAEDPSLAIPTGCPAAGGRDVAAEIAAAGRGAAEAVVPALRSAWAGELRRLAALERVTAGVEEACAARHRRVRPDDLAGARDEVRRFLEDLGKREMRGAWIAARGQERVPGVGPVAVLARTEAGAGDALVEAASLVERLRSLDRCRGAGERVIQAALVDVGTSEVVFMGLFFEEELLCESLPPSGA